MTEIVFIPRHLVEAWKKKGWIILESQVSDEHPKWAVPMVPKSWIEEHLRHKWEKIAEGIAGKPEEDE